MSFIYRGKTDQPNGLETYDIMPEGLRLQRGGSEISLMVTAAYKTFFKEIKERQKTLPER